MKPLQFGDIVKLKRTETHWCLDCFTDEGFFDIEAKYFVGIIDNIEHSFDKNGNFFSQFGLIICGEECYHGRHYQSWFSSGQVIEKYGNIFDENKKEARKIFIDYKNNGKN